MSDLVTAAESGDVRATLVALRNRLAREIEASESGRDIAALSNKLTDVLDRLEALPGGEESTAADEIAKRREQRRNAG